MNIHPKTSGAGVGVAFGVLIVAILASIHGVHLTPEANAAIPSFLGITLSWLTPSSPNVSPPTPVPVVLAPVAPAAPVTAVAPVAPADPIPPATPLV